MNKLTEKKQVNGFTVLFAAIYMVSYITRINYGAIIVEMESAIGFSKSMLSLAVTGSFITYGIGQIISGIIADRISPKSLITFGLGLTVQMNILIPVCSNPYQMLVVWCINGFAQSFMWPPLVRLMSTFLTENDYNSAITKVSWGSSIGTIVVYLFSPILISFFGWKSVFWFSAASGIFMIFIWNKYANDAPSQNREKTKLIVTDKKYSLFTPLMIFIMIAIVLQGMLRDGVTTWMPSYIKDTYNFGSAISILTGVVLPIFSILSFYISEKVYVKKFTNPIACAGLFFGISVFSAFGILLFSGTSAVFSVVFSALLTGCMHGVNLMLIGIIPRFFEKGGKVSMVSGVINSCTYIGSAISTYGIALLSEKVGWTFTLLSWLLIALVGTAICLLCIKPWGKRF